MKRGARERSQDSSSVVDIEADIARTREQLATTVDELTARMDVKARVQDSAKHRKERAVAGLRAARERLMVDGQPSPVAAGAGVALILATVAVVVWRTRSRRP